MSKGKGLIVKICKVRDHDARYTRDAAGRIKSRIQAAVRIIADDGKVKIDAVICRSRYHDFPVRLNCDTAGGVIDSDGRRHNTACAKC